MMCDIDNIDDNYSDNDDDSVGDDGAVDDDEYNGYHAEQDDKYISKHFTISASCVDINSIILFLILLFLILLFLLWDKFITLLTFLIEGYYLWNHLFKKPIFDYW